MLFFFLHKKNEAAVQRPTRSAELAAKAQKRAGNLNVETMETRRRTCSSGAGVTGDIADTNGDRPRIQTGGKVDSSVGGTEVRAGFEVRAWFHYSRGLCISIVARSIGTDA